MNTVYCTVLSCTLPECSTLILTFPPQCIITWAALPIKGPIQFFSDSSCILSFNKMEYEGLGARCSLASCRKLDYLPYKCANCALPFCESHHLPSQHSCQSATPKFVPTCPMCNAAVPAKNGQTLDDAMAIHIDNGCPKRPRSYPICSFASCNVRDPAATECPSCHQVFCISHCVEINHQCKASKTPNPNILINKQLERNKRLKQKSSSDKPAKNLFSNIGSTGSSNKTAVISTNFANSKTSPIGDNLNSIDAEDKIHLSVLFHVPSSSSGDQLIKPRYMCFTNKNSAGRIIDVIRKHVKEVPPPPKGQRYSLYGIKSDLSRVNLLPYVAPLREMSDTITSGDLVVLQVGDSGLDPSVLNALKIAERSGLFAGSTSTRFAAGRRIPKPPQRKGNKCLMV